MLIIVKCGRKPLTLADVPGDYEQWFSDGLGVDPCQVRSVDVERGEPLPEHAGVDGVVVTGSAAMVTDRLDWAKRSAAWLGAAVGRGIPVLGVCFGHQLLAHALGGAVENNPNGLEVGTVTARKRDAAAGDPLFGPLPDPFDGQASHWQSVTTLPPGALLLASTAADPNSAFRYGDRAWGLQLHPEFDELITDRFVAWHRRPGDREVLPVSRPTPELHALLKRFGTVCLNT